MKKLSILILVFLFACQSSPAFSQLYKDDGVFQGTNLELKGDTFHIVEWFCTGNYFSKGIFLRKRDTLYLTSSAEYDNRKLQVRGNWVQDADSVHIKIKLYMDDKLKKNDLNYAIISLVGKDSIVLNMQGKDSISLPLSILPIHDIYFDQKRASMFFPYNQFTLYYDLPYEDHFVRLINEPFYIKGDTIYPIHYRFGYMYMTKVKK